MFRSSPSLKRVWDMSCELDDLWRLKIFSSLLTCATLERWVDIGQGEYNNLTDVSGATGSSKLFLEKLIVVQDIGRCYWLASCQLRRLFHSHQTSCYYWLKWVDRVFCSYQKLLLFLTRSHVPIIRLSVLTQILHYFITKQFSFIVKLSVARSRPTCLNKL